MYLSLTPPDGGFPLGWLLHTDGVIRFSSPQCPFHGLIVARDDRGRPLSEEDRRREEQEAEKRREEQPGERGQTSTHSTLTFLPRYLRGPSGRCALSCALVGEGPEGAEWSCLKSVFGVLKKKQTQVVDQVVAF